MARRITCTVGVRGVLRQPRQQIAGGPPARQARTAGTPARSDAERGGIGRLTTRRPRARCSAGDRTSRTSDTSSAAGGGRRCASAGADGSAAIVSQKRSPGQADGTPIKRVARRQRQRRKPSGDSGALDLVTGCRSRRSIHRRQRCRRHFCGRDARCLSFDAGDGNRMRLLGFMVLLFFHFAPVPASRSNSSAQRM